MYLRRSINLSSLRTKTNLKHQVLLIQVIKKSIKKFLITIVIVTDNNFVYALSWRYVIEEFLLRYRCDEVINEFFQKLAIIYYGLHGKFTQPEICVIVKILSLLMMFSYFEIMVLQKTRDGF